MSTKQQTQPQNKTQAPAHRTAAPEVERAPLPGVAVVADVASDLPNHPTAQPLRQAAMLRMQQHQGNGHVQRMLARQSGQRSLESINEFEQVSEEAAGEADRPITTATPPPDEGKNGNGVIHSPIHANGNGHSALKLGNGASALQREEEGEAAPTEAEKAAALAAAAAADAIAAQARGQGQGEIAASQSKAETESSAAGSAKDKASAEKESIAPPKESSAAGTPGASKPSAPQAEEKPGQNGAGPGAAPSAFSANGGAPTGEKAPASPEEDPAFQSVAGSVVAVAGQEKTHAPAAAKASEAQAAAEAPAAEVEGRAQSNQVDEMERAETPPFDAAAFKARLMERIQALAPKTAKEADEFKDGDKLGSVQGEMRGQAAEQQKQSQAPVAAATAQAPNTAGVPPKPVDPLETNEPGQTPPVPAMAGATPKPKTPAEVEAPLQEESRQPDQKLAEADVTEEQLANSNEPEFQGALDAKAEAKTHAQTGPEAYRQGEAGQIAQAEAEATATAEARTQAMHTDRANVLAQVGGKQQQGKSADEKARQEVGAHIQTIYSETKSKVEAILGSLDREVGEIFTPGAEAAKQVFESFVDAKMEAFKEERYGGWFGWARWAKDKLLGMPSEVNAFYTEGRQLFIQKMDAVIDNVVALISRRLTEAKAEIANGKKRIQEYVNSLPEELQTVGQQAAEDIQGQFDQLEADVDNKQNELVDSLAKQYQTHLQAVDARIEELKAANRGLVDKALDAVVGVIKIILQLKDMLLNILAKVADVVGKIIKDPIGFLGNLISGVKQGLENFVSRIGEHLKKGLMTWLFGELAEAGIELPETFDIKGILMLVMQVLGFTWENLRARAVKMFGEKVVAGLEQAFEIFIILKEQGLGGLWEFIQEQLSNLKDMVIEGIQELVTNEVIKAGVQWLIGILGGPAGAFIKACKAIYDIVMWFVNNGSKVMSLIDAVIDGIAAVAGGSLGQMAKAIENALAQALPVVISFLASLLGLGNLGQKIRGVIQKVQAPITKAIDWVLEKAKAAVKKLGKHLGFGKDEDDKSDQSSKEAEKLMDGPEGVEATEGMSPIHEPVQIGAEQHHLDSEPGSFALVLHSADPGHNLNDHPAPAVKKAYKAYLNSLAQATSQEAKNATAKQKVEEIVTAIQNAGLSPDEPLGSAPGLGSDESHGAQPPRQRAGPQIWKTESEHIIPFAVGKYLWRIFAESLPGRGGSVDKNQKTLIIYERAARIKTPGDNTISSTFKSDVDRLNLRQRLPRLFEILSDRHESGDQSAKAEGRELLAEIITPLTRAQEDAANRTNDAIIQEWGETENDFNKKNGERRGEKDAVPSAGRVEEVAAEQFDDVIDLIRTELTRN